MKIKTQWIHQIPVQGIQINERSGCLHYHTEIDIVAIKFKCCLSYYACYECHHEMQHPIQRWKTNEFNEKAILCGGCGSQMTIQEYLTCDSQCPYCAASFNPRCANHWHYYFLL